jgi:hypothetical protein
VRTKAKKVAKEQEIVIATPKVEHLRVTVVGTSPLVMHAWGKKLGVMEADKARRSDGNAPKKRNTKRDPAAECEDAMHWLPGKVPAIPAVSFKRAMVGACRNIDGLDMVRARGLFFVEGELLPIKGGWKMRTDAVRVPPGTGGAEARYRPEFKTGWQVALTIKFLSNLISAACLLNLLQLAGINQGVGEMRPSAPGKDFNFGQFTIKEKRRGSK